MTLVSEARVPAAALAPIYAPFEAFGGAWTDPAVLLPLSLLLDLAGEAMRERLFVVEGPGTEPSVLRPDFTIPIAQAHLAAGNGDGRYLYEGRAFRTPPPHSGRPAEFLQVGAEVLGPPTDPPAEDAEIAALAWASASAGGRTDLAMLLGDVSLFASFMRAIGIPEPIIGRLARAFQSERALSAELTRAAGPEAAAPAGGERLARMLADLPETEAAGVLEELWRLAGIQPVGGRSASEIVHRLVARAEGARGPRLSGAEAELIARYLKISAPPRAALEQVEVLAYQAKVEFDIQLQPWVQRLKALDAVGVPQEALTLATGFARPFGYYDGMLFEIRSAALGPDQPVAAGGRYDSLPVRLGGDEEGAVGCMVRPARAWKGAGG